MEKGITASVGEIAASQNQITPEWIRLPKGGTLCPWSGLSRSKLNELILPNAHNHFKPVVRSICLRNRGQQRGVRLVVFDSLMEYLRGFLDALPQSIEHTGAN
jgi:hypothetical protein